MRAALIGVQFGEGCSGRPDALLLPNPSVLQGLDWAWAWARGMDPGLQGATGRVRVAVVIVKASTRHVRVFPGISSCYINRAWRSCMPASERASITRNLRRLTLTGDWEPHDMSQDQEGTSHSRAERRHAAVRCSLLDFVVRLVKLSVAPLISTNQPNNLLNCSNKLA
jgi:hypothetical protein